MAENNISNDNKNEDGYLPEEFEILKDLDLLNYSYFKGRKNRELYINGQIDDTVVEKYIMPIKEWNEEDEKYGIPVEKRKPIKIYMSCVGGTVTYGLALIDEIKLSKTPVYGICISHAYSMGFLILLACHYKMGYKFSSYLLHDGSMMISNSTSKVKNYIEYSNEQEEMIKNFILENTKITEEQYDNNYTNEWYMTSAKALQLGVIDKIME